MWACGREDGGDGCGMMRRDRCWGFAVGSSGLVSDAGRIGGAEYVARDVRWRVVLFRPMRRFVDILGGGGGDVSSLNVEACFRFLDLDFPVEGGLWSLRWRRRGSRMLLLLGLFDIDMEMLMWKEMVDRKFIGMEIEKNYWEVLRKKFGVLRTCTVDLE